MRAYLARTICAFALLTTPCVALAHHSHGNYDVRNYTQLEGTVAAVVWLNPHIWLQLETDNGESWALEGGSIQAVASGGGWKEGDLKNGDRISVRCHALRDGANGCLLGYITPDGEDERVFD